LQGILVRTFGGEMFAFANSAHNILALQCLSHLNFLFVNLLISSGCLSIWWGQLQWNVFSNSSGWEIRSRFVSLLFSKLCPLFSLSYRLVDVFCDKFGFDFASDLGTTASMKEFVNGMKKGLCNVYTLTFLPSSLSRYSTITFKPSSSV
jgi:hypothetical protein